MRRNCVRLRSKWDGRHTWAGTGGKDTYNTITQMTLGREGEKFIRYNAQAKAGQQQVKQRLQKLKKILGARSL